jgi:hypothetical protein
MFNDRICLNDERELRAWAHSLNATPEAVKDAVEAVGESPEAVLTYLAKQPRSARQRWEWAAANVLVGGAS